MTKAQVENLKPYFYANYSIPPEMDEQKIAEREALEKMAQEKTKVTRFGELPTASPEMDEQKIAEEKTKAASFGELPAVSAEHSETNINANDPEVQGLINAKQKNMKRSISASRAQKAYQASKGYENDFPIRDYMPNVSDEELRKAGITKTELNKLSSILAGNGTDEDVRN